MNNHPRQAELDHLRGEAIQLVGGNGAFALSPKHFMLMAIHDAHAGKQPEADFTKRFGLNTFFQGISFDDMVRLDGIIDLMNAHARFGA